MHDDATYLLFSGYYYYPAGGWQDFCGAFPSLAAAQQAWAARWGEQEWAQIVEAGTLTVVSQRADEGKWQPP